MTRTVGVGVIGTGWMGQAHARAYRLVLDRYHDLGIQPRLVVVASRQAQHAELSRQRFGFERCTTNWIDVVHDPEVEVVNITTPNGLHLPMVRAAAGAGKHILCEKPVGKDWRETVQAEAAARSAGIISFVAYNYRWVPVIQYVKGLIESGRLGQITHYHGRFLTSYASNPHNMLSWRFQAEHGMGVTSDIGSHVIDMAHLLVGPVRRLVSTREIFIRKRPLPVSEEDTHFNLGSDDSPMGDVTNEDYLSVLTEFENGARGILEASRVIIGPTSDLSFEIHGTLGAAKWGFERMNELQLFWRDEKHPAEEGFATIFAGPAHGAQGRFNPSPGLNIGYEDLKVIEAAEFLKCLRDGQQREPSMNAALQVANVQAAIERSWSSGRWEQVVSQRLD